MGESALNVGSSDNPEPAINDIIGREPSAEFAVSVSEECEILLNLLPDESMKQLALLKMEGYNNKEIAAELNCGLRTIERRLGLIRKIWNLRG